MNTAFNPYRTTRAARRYVSPRTRPLNQFERETRGLSYMLKEADCPEAALQVAAAEMAALLGAYDRGLDALDQDERDGLNAVIGKLKDELWP